MDNIPLPENASNRDLESTGTLASHLLFIPSPPSRYCLSSTLAALLRRHAGRASKAALPSAFTPQSDRRRVLFLLSWHVWNYTCPRTQSQPTLLDFYVPAHVQCEYRNKGPYRRYPKGP